MAPISRNSANTAKDKNYREFASFIAMATLIAVSLQLNGMLIMWKIQQAMGRCRPGRQNSSRFHPGNRAEVLIWPKIFKTLNEIPVGKTEISGTEPARPLTWTHRKFYKGFRGKARSRKTGPAQSTGLMWSGPENLFLLFEMCTCGWIMRRGCPCDSGFK